MKIADASNTRMNCGPFGNSKFVTRKFRFKHEYCTEFDVEFRHIDPGSMVRDLLDIFFKLGSNTNPLYPESTYLMSYF